MLAAFFQACTVTTEEISITLSALVKTSMLCKFLFYRPATPVVAVILPPLLFSICFDSLLLDFLLGYTVLVSSDFEGNMLPSEPKQQISKSIYFIGKRIKHKSPDSKNKC